MSEWLQDCEVEENSDVPFWIVGRISEYPDKKTPLDPVAALDDNSLSDCGQKLIVENNGPLFMGALPVEMGHEVGRNFPSSPGGKIVLEIV